MKQMNKPVKRLVFEVFEKNKKPFDDCLTEYLLLEMAQACYSGYDKVAGSEVIPGQCLRFYVIKAGHELYGNELPLRTFNLLPELTYVDYYDVQNRYNFDEYKYRFLNFHDAVYEMGKPVIVTALDTLFRVTDNDIKEWLAVFGPLKELTRFVNS